MKAVRNVTFSLPVDLLRRAKVLAAERDLSLNTLVKAALEEKVGHLTEYRKAGDRLLALTRTPLYTIPERMWDRSSLYE